MALGASPTPEILIYAYFRDLCQLMFRRARSDLGDFRGRRVIGGERAIIALFKEKRKNNNIQNGPTRCKGETGSHNAISRRKIPGNFGFFGNTGLTANIFACGRSQHWVKDT